MLLIYFISTIVTIQKLARENTRVMFHRPGGKRNPGGWEGENDSALDVIIQSEKKAGSEGWLFICDVIG